VRDLKKRPTGLDVRGDVEYNCLALLHKMGLIVELARAYNSSICRCKMYFCCVPIYSCGLRLASSAMRRLARGDDSSGVSAATYKAMLAAGHLAISRYGQLTMVYRLTAAVPGD
jgi:hypothetical protein